VDAHEFGTFCRRKFRKKVHVWAALVQPKPRWTAFAKIKIARETGVTGKQFRPQPHLVIANGIVIRTFKPCMILVAFLFLGVADRKNHGTQEWLLRAAQVLRASRVQNASIMLNFETEVLDHATSEMDAVVTQ